MSFVVKHKDQCFRRPFIKDKPVKIWIEVVGFSQFSQWVMHMISMFIVSGHGFTNDVGFELVSSLLNQVLMASITK